MIKNYIFNWVISQHLEERLLFYISRLILYARQLRLTSVNQSCKVCLCCRTLRDFNVASLGEQLRTSANQAQFYVLAGRLKSVNPSDSFSFLLQVDPLQSWHQHARAKGNESRPFLAPQMGAHQIPRTDSQTGKNRFYEEAFIYSVL